MKARKIWKFLILLAVSFIQISIAGPADFDIIVLSQQWPKTTCIPMDKVSTQCILPQHDDWTIHGVWPSKLNGEKPRNCKNVDFKIEALSTIRNRLISQWPNIYGTNNDLFWKQEWMKHGTCVLGLPNFNTQLEYFQTALNLNKQYNIKKMLKEGKIVPGQNYLFKDIFEQLKTTLGFATKITCRKNKDEQYIHEVRICLNKKLGVIDCISRTNCNENSKIKYPARR